MPNDESESINKDMAIVAEVARLILKGQETIDLAATVIRETEEFLKRHSPRLPAKSTWAN